MVSTGDAPEILFEFAQIVWIFHGPLRLSLLTFTWTRDWYKKCTRTRLIPGASSIAFSFVFLTVLCCVLCACRGWGPVIGADS